MFDDDPPLEAVPPMEATWDPREKLPWKLVGYSRLRRPDGSLQPIGRVVLSFETKAARENFGKEEARVLAQVSR